jgi:ATP-dependent DNA helicase RecG
MMTSRRRATATPHTHGLVDAREFEKRWCPADVLRTLCAFANDFHDLGGAHLVIG